jgi:mono/diheme cytochrome c family protein
MVAMKRPLLLWFLTVPLACLAGEHSGWWLHRTSPAFRALDNPLSSDPDATRAGAKLFEHHCAACHGQDAQGIEKAPALRSPVVREAPPGSLFWLLRNGILRRGMPSWSHLPEEQRWQIVTWLKSIQ